MKTIKQFSITLFLFIFANYLGAFEANEPNFEETSLNTYDSEMIYIQQAKVAELTCNPNKLGKYLLKVSGSDKTLVYFSDKPNREAGTVTLSQFVKSWENNGELQTSPPNVVISYVNFKSTSEDGVGADVLQLTNPKYNYSEDSVTFEAEPLHEFKIMTGRFENVVMVFDGLSS